MTFANKLRWERQKAGKSRREVADAVGVTVFTVKSWELGLAEPRHRAFNALCVLFGVQASELEGDTAA